MSALAEDCEGEADVDVERVTAVGASVFGYPVWPQAYNDFVHVVDCAAWVHERLAQADFDPIGVTESSLASQFVRHMLACVEESRGDAVPVDQQNNVLAMLMLLCW